MKGRTLNKFAVRNLLAIIAYIVITGYIGTLFVPYIYYPDKPFDTWLPYALLGTLFITGAILALILLCCLLASLYNWLLPRTCLFFIVRPTTNQPNDKENKDSQ